ncbi:MAG: prepilin-type N-terminal cleavage/methylation domain-containing protein [Candidatus Harrisonbacteria bacterium]|nr:prepilin-type N-terminal cleavage/methylation domain-containing protein [Candidatus Harrisonbacteria bacterium]
MAFAKKSFGFTLIEVLVVVFIIGLLSSVVLVGLGTFRARGRDARRAADLRSIQNALELYYQKEGMYPTATSWSELTSILVGGGIGLSGVPNDPKKGASYDYAVSSDNERYILRAELEDVSNTLLNDDVDGSGGETYSINCDDEPNAYYCIQL